MRNWILGTAAAIVAGLGAPADSGAAPSRVTLEYSCTPAGEIRFICGSGAPEDLERIPGTNWVIATGFAGRVGLRLVNVRSESIDSIVFPSPQAEKTHDRSLYPNCPGPLSAEAEATASTHGTSLQRRPDGAFTLYVTHHGARESVEVFKITPMGARRPKIAWIGCVVAPDDAILNAVAALPGNGFAVTNMFRRNPNWVIASNVAVQEIYGSPMADAAAPGMRERSGRGENTGYLLEWHPGSGWKKLEGTDAPTPNGIAASEDGRYLYSVYSPGKLMRLTRGAGAPRREDVSVGVRGDNIKLSADGRTLLIGGSPTDATGFGQGKIVMADAQTLKPVQEVDSPIAGATTALPVGRDLWVGSARLNRIVILPGPSAR